VAAPAIIHPSAKKKNSTNFVCTPTRLEGTRGVKMRKVRGVAISPRARAVLEEHGVNAAELVAAWRAEEEEEMLVLTRGEQAVVLIYEDGGMVQLSTPQDLRGATGG
jgi:hypothetical protein